MKKLAVAVAALTATAVSAQTVRVPADVSVGPAAYWFYGALLNDRGAVPHFALAFDLYAIVDQEQIQKNQDRIPANYRNAAAKMDEVRIGPSIFIPNTVYVSPKIDALGQNGLFGLTWRPLALILLSSAKKSDKTAWRKPRGRAEVDAGLILTTLFLYGDDPRWPFTFFLRPGLDLKISLEAYVTQSFHVSLNFGVQAYVPQQLGSFGFGPLDESISFAGFANLKFHYRFPYDAKL
jgi:hypothetical protein